MPAAPVNVTPNQAVQFCKDAEKFKMFFIEDPLSPEDLPYFRQIRQQCATPGRNVLLTADHRPEEEPEDGPERVLDEPVEHQDLRPKPASTRPLWQDVSRAAGPLSIADSRDVKPPGRRVVNRWTGHDKSGPFSVASLTDGIGIPFPGYV